VSNGKNIYFLKILSKKNGLNKEPILQYFFATRTYPQEHLKSKNITKNTPQDAGYFQELDIISSSS